MNPKPQTDNDRLREILEAQGASPEAVAACLKRHAKNANAEDDKRRAAIRAKVAHLEKQIAALEAKNPNPNKEPRG